MNAKNLAWIAGAVGLGFTFVFAIPNSKDSAPQTASELIVHEWGTFTSVFGSDGGILPGVHRDEEALPGFVYAHYMGRGFPQFHLEGDPGPPKVRIFGKGFNRPLHNVTVKMETPVLYFYGATDVDAHVRVGFRGGSISQWYPARSGGEELPALIRQGSKLVSGAMDFAKPYDGAIEWKFRIEPRTEETEFEVMKPGELPNWLHPRAPKSNVLRTPSGQTETYLFYRGVGNFEQPIQVRIDDGRLMVNAREDVPFLLAADIAATGEGRILWQGDPGTSQTIDLSHGEPGPIRTRAYQALKTALTEAGLYEDEARAMLRTWWHSYFGKPGLRLFWVVPREFTDAVLPIDVEPRPSSMERVLLGRSEILTPEFEKVLLTEFAKEDVQNRFFSDRYGLAYQARVNALKTPENAENAENSPAAVEIQPVGE